MGSLGRRRRVAKGVRGLKGADMGEDGVWEIFSRGKDNDVFWLRPWPRYKGERDAWSRYIGKDGTGSRESGL